MSASQLQPNTYNGQERSGGYIAKNSKQTSASAPDFKGRVYLIGVGWHWVSGWKLKGKNSHMIRLDLEELTDEQFRKYFLRLEKPASEERHTNGTGEIPF